MRSTRELQQLVSEPREDLSVEHKGWLNLNETKQKATLAKAAIALANHGGGFVVIGLAEQGASLHSAERPPHIPEITQDSVNAAIRRYATPEFHCEVYNVEHPTTRVVHPIVTVPSDIRVPVMTKREVPGVIPKNRCYIRKPGPRSEEPQTEEEWRELFDRCLRAGREDMLEGIRSIVLGRVELQEPTPNALSELQTYCDEARDRWKELVADQPKDAPARFPDGYYEMGFSLVGAQPANGLADIQSRLANARKIKLTGWSVFLDIQVAGRTPYPHKNFVEAWLGTADRTPSQSHLCDFWRVSTDGKLYTIRGYIEDGVRPDQSGTVLDIGIPIWRVAEALLFVSRFAETFDSVDEIAIQCRFAGLSGRHLTSLDGRRPFFSGGHASTDEVTLEDQVTPKQVQDNLVEVLHTLLLPLYEHFNFFKLPLSLVDEEIKELLARRY